MELFTTHLPSDVCILINTFNPVHREKMFLVLEELVYYNTLTRCDNDMCEKEISIENAIEGSILGGTYYFCDENCQSNGEWSIRYDWRKAMRH